MNDILNIYQYILYLFYYELYIFYEDVHIITINIIVIDHYCYLFCCCYYSYYYQYNNNIIDCYILPRPIFMLNLVIIVKFVSYLIWHVFLINTIYYYIYII